jgi:putative hemolysin
VLANGLFVAAEYALVTARRIRLTEQAEAGSRGARIALRLMEDPVRFIGAIQLGITICSILVGAIGESLISRFFDPYMPRSIAFVLSFSLLTYVTVIFGETVPKSVTLQHSERVGRVLAVPLSWFSTVFAPVIWLLQISAEAVTRPFGFRPTPAGIVTYTREDILHSVAAAEDVGEIEEAEEEMLYKVFNFADKEVSEVMVPRPEVVAISVDLPPEAALSALIDSPYTRYPAYRGSLDEIAGILHVRDLFSALHDRGIAQVNLAELLRAPFMVPETKDLAALLADFRRTKQHMAVVIDEYGAMEGIVTLEDVLEEIVGEIEDEFDLPDESVERLDDHTILIGGTFPIDDFNEQFGTELPVEDFHTIAGFVFGQIGRAPEEGDQVEWDGVRFEVVEVEGSRIERLQAEFPREEDLAASAES